MIKHRLRAPKSIKPAYYDPVFFIVVTQGLIIGPVVFMNANYK